MIVKILLPDKEDPTKTFTMLFGNSYKKWQTQFSEFMFRYYKPDPSMGWDQSYVRDKAIKAWKSNAKWIGWGGLKWCNENIFQGELNREGCQTDDPDNPNPRLYSEMQFFDMNLGQIEKALDD